MSQTSATQLNNDFPTGTSKELNTPSIEGYVFVKGQKNLELGKTLHFYQIGEKSDGWGLFEQLQVEEEDIEEAKNSLFPERAF